MSGSQTQSIRETFDRVMVVNLARRSQRLAQFQNNLVDWPFLVPQRFEAVDGNAVGTPAGWNKGAGAWGCLLSHVQIVEQAIADNAKALLVLEDDACPVANFSARAAVFLDSVPGDWDGLMFGTEHLTPPNPICPGVVRCHLSNRTHAYAVRGRFMGILAQFWRNTKDDHCDIVLASLMPHFKVYAPDPLLIGQDAGQSDVTGKAEPQRFVQAA
jgi:hypothetical protein